MNILRLWGIKDIQVVNLIELLRLCSKTRRLVLGKLDKKVTFMIPAHWERLQAV